MMGKPAGYQVFWHPEAEEQLTTLWITAKERAAISAAADAFDQAIRQNPNGVGESRDKPYRLSVFRPLGFIFRISDVDRTVWVIRVWRVRRAR